MNVKFPSTLPTESLNTIRKLILSRQSSIHLMKLERMMISQKCQSYALDFRELLGMVDGNIKIVWHTGRDSNPWSYFSDPLTL